MDITAVLKADMASRETALFYYLAARRKARKRFIVVARIMPLS